MPSPLGVLASGYWTPADLAPYAYYDTAIGEPKNVGYAQLMGTAGDYIYTADKAALDLTGDQEVVMRLSCVDWDNANEEQFASKYNTTGNQRSWRDYHAAGSSTPGFAFSVDGSAVLTRSATASLLSVGAVDGTALWYKRTLDVDNGASGHDVKFWYSLSTSFDEPSSWTQLGATVTTAGVASVFSGSANLNLGAYSAGATTPLNGRVSRFIQRSGIDGTVVADFDARNCYADGFTDAYSNVWLIAVPKIYDRSANGRAPVISASGSNAPTVLSWRGTSYVFLTAAGTGTNSVSCTAPSGTASYSAVPESGAAPTTGAASPGAFSFTTAGKWASISLLNGSAVEVAKYDAALSTRTGHTDSYAVAWTVNRGTAGNKTAVRSLAAGTNYTVWQYDGSDDYATGPAAAYPPAGTADNLSIVSVQTLWATQAFSWIVGNGAGAGSPEKGTRIIVTSASDISGRQGDGTSAVNITRSITSGIRHVFALVVSAAGQTLTVNLNGFESGSSSLAALGDRGPSTTFRIGTSPITTLPTAMTHRTVLTFTRALTAAEISQIVAYFAGTA